MKHIYTFLCLFLLGVVPCAYGETITSDDGREYVGEVKSGKFHGQGTLTLPNGTKYVGEFQDGEITGYGTLTLADGTKYVGEFSNSLKNGHGTAIWADSSEYVGQWKNDHYHGVGTLTMGLNRYVGEWKNGNMWNGARYHDGGLLMTFSKGMTGNPWAKEHQLLNTTKSCTGCDMSGGNFSFGGGSMLFSRKDLVDINLTGAVLKKANLFDSNLTRATLNEANLTGADLTNANLTDANLSRANLTEANLMNVNFTGANLTGAVLDGTYNTSKATYCKTIMPDGSVNNSGC